MRVYVPKTIGFLLLFTLLIVIGLVLLVFYQAYGGRKLVNPLERLKPLGQSSKTGKIQEVAGGSSSSKDALTIVFYYESYESQEKALTDIEVLKGAIALVEPYKSLKDYISYQVFTSDSKKCEVEKETQYLVCDKELIDSFKALGAERFKVVLMSQEHFVSASEQARGKNSWITLSTNPPAEVSSKRNEWMGLVLTRLLGYSLGLSYESGMDTVEPSIPPDAVIQSLSYNGKPNCAPNRETAASWWGGYAKIFPNIGFFQGCGGHKDYYYPQEGTLMSLDPKKETYGLVSEDYLRGVLTCFYAKKDKMVFPAGKTATQSASLSSCNLFMKDYPNFWVE